MNFQERQHLYFYQSLLKMIESIPTTVLNISYELAFPCFIL
jgi:hypothetical protein